MADKIYDIYGIYVQLYISPWQNGNEEATTAADKEVHSASLVQLCEMCCVFESNVCFRASLKKVRKT